MGCYIWYSEEEPLVALPNVTAHPSTASVPITVLLYNGPLLCGFNVPIKLLIIRWLNLFNLPPLFFIAKTLYNIKYF